MARSESMRTILTIPSQTTELAADLVSYINGLATNPALLSLASVFETDTAALATISEWEASVSSVVQAGHTPGSDFLSGLPTEAQSFFGSVYTAEASLAAKNGFTSQAAVATGGATATSTKSGNAAPTGAALGLSAAALGGFVAVMAAL